MGIRTLLYLFRLGFKNLWHHRVYTAASVITMSACILDVYKRQILCAAMVRI